MGDRKKVGPRSSSRAFKATKDILQQGRKTVEISSDLAKIISKPKKVSNQVRETGAVTVDLEKDIRDKVMKKKWGLECFSEC